MKKPDIKNNGLTKVVAMLLAACVVIGLVSSSAIKLAASTYFMQTSRRLKTNIPFVDSMIDTVIGDAIPDDSATNVTPAPETTVPTTQAPTTTEPTTQAPETSAPETSAPATDDATEPPTSGDSGSGAGAGGLGDILGGLDIGGMLGGLGGLAGGLGDITGSLGDIGGLLGGGGATEEETTTEPETDSDAAIKQKKEVLSSYKDIVNYAKVLGKPSFTKVTYRTLEKGFVDGFLLHSVEAAYPEYFISKDNAEAAPIVVPANTATSEFLIDNENYACMLATADASAAIQSATSVKLEDGSQKIVITLREEADPAVTTADAKKAASFTSSMFPVITAEEFEGMVAPTLKITSITSTSVKYKDCTVELVYSPLTKRIISIKQSSTYVGEVKGQLITAKGTVTEVSEYKDFDYGII